MSEFLPKICIKCKRKDTDIKEFNYVITKKSFASFFSRSKSFSNIELKLPVCDSCSRDLKKFNKYHNYYEGTKYYIYCSLLIAVFFGYAMITYSSFEVWVFPVIFSGYVLISFILGIIIIIRFTSSDRIEKLIKLVGKNQVEIKDQEFLTEVKTKLNSKIVESFETEDKEIFCPKCGAKESSKADFCNSCGKDLRVLK